MSEAIGAGIADERGKVVVIEDKRGGIGVECSYKGIGAQFQTTTKSLILFYVL